MRHINVSIADDELYRQLEAAAADRGRALDEMIAEALGEWIHAHPNSGRHAKARELAALRSLDEIRSRQPQRRAAEDLLNDIRDERA